MKLLKTASSGPVWRSFVALCRDMTGVVAVGITVVLGLALGGRGDLTNTAIAILFVIAIVSMRLGYRAAILAAGAGALSFDYFFLPPYGSIRIFHIRDMVTDAAMFCVAVLIGTLNERFRKQAESARVSERRTEALYALVKDLAAARSVDEVCVAGLGHIETVAGVPARVLIREESEVFNSAVSSVGRTGIEVGDLEVSRWVANHLEPAGQGTQSFSTASARYYPLVATRGCVGVLVLQAHGSLPTDGSRPLLVVQSMSQQLAMAIERMLLSFEKRAAEVEAESERIRNAVLSAVSHDLRTPLTVITSASSTLVEHGERLPAGARAEMSRLINEEAKRLSDLLKSLLDVTRLQSGGLRVNRDWESLEEVVGSVLRRVEEGKMLGLRQIRTHVPSDLPLLQIDAILIEQVLSNLIENALAYARNDFPVEIDIATRGERDVLVSVIDHGEGMRTDEMTHIFEKFYRSNGTSGPGLGLGLTLARGIVETHGGKIWATHTPGGGLTVQFSLPIGNTAPPMMESETIEGMRAWGR